jgi:ElaA protein
MTSGAAPTVRAAPFDALDAATLYGILALRAAVFVVEQACAYCDPDGRDTEAGAFHLWVERDGEVIATLRMVEEPDGSVRIGRVAVALAARGAHIASALMDTALERCTGRTAVLDAQQRLVPWYERLGFAVSGPDFVEDGIPHTPMRLPLQVEGGGGVVAGVDRHHERRRPRDPAR